MSKKISLLGVLLLAACGTNQPLPTQDNIELQSYMGTWYQQAHLPNRFQKKCVANTQAEYQLKQNNTVQVVNSCRQADGTISRAQGVARFATQPPNPAQLEVRFAPEWLSWLPWVWGDYWILTLADDGNYSLVGSPNRRYLWVLSRHEQADPKQVQKLLEYARDLDFDIQDIQFESPSSPF